MKAVAYIRVSTEAQNLGPEVQDRMITDWAKREGHEIVSTTADLGLSGGSEMAVRPGLVSALGHLRAHRADFLVVAKRDRLARDTFIALTIERAVEKCGARVVTADGIANGDDPASKFLRTILDGAAEYERALIAGRTKAALRVKKDHGAVLGRAPFGYRKAQDTVGKWIMLEVDQASQKVLSLMVSLYGSGSSTKQIAERLTDDGIPTPSGKPSPWGKSTVISILSRLQQLHERQPWLYPSVKPVRNEEDADDRDEPGGPSGVDAGADEVPLRPLVPTD